MVNNGNTVLFQLFQLSANTEQTAAHCVTGGPLYIAILYRASNICSPPFANRCSSRNVAVYICVVAGFACLRVYCTCSNVPPALRILTAVVCLKLWAVYTRLLRPTPRNPRFAIEETARVVIRPPVLLRLSDANNGALGRVSLRVLR